jgi:hypothetical protein
MKNVKLNEKVINYFEIMIDEFCCGNDNEYKVGSKVSFLFEEIEKGDLDLYEEEDVNNFFKIREFIKNEGGEVKYIGKFDDERFRIYF